MPDSLLNTLGVSTVAFALAFAVPAQAQLNNGASGYSSAPREASMAEYWRMLDGLGPCLANMKRDEAEAFVDEPIDSEAEAEAFDRLFSTNDNVQRNVCMGNFTSVSGARRAHFRGVVAEGLFANLADDQLTSSAASLSAEPFAVTTLHDFARCYVISHPEETRQLLSRTDLATRGELAAIRAMAADFASCLPQDREVSLNPTNVRMALAEAAWRIATGRAGATIQGRN